MDFDKKTLSSSSVASFSTFARFDVYNEASSDLVLTPFFRLVYRANKEKGEFHFNDP
jgi:hypothetical protein